MRACSRCRCVCIVFGGVGTGCLLTCMRQAIDTILAWLVAEDDGARAHVQQRLAERDEGLWSLRATLQEQLDGMGSGDEGGDGSLRDMLGTLIEFL